MRSHCLTRSVASILFLLALPLTFAIGRVAANGPGKSYAPVITGGAVAPDCSIPGTSYQSLSILGPPLTVDPERDPDLNLAYRGYAPTTAPLELVTLGPVHDRNAPQFPSLFADNRTPRFTAAYQRYRWDEDCDCPLDTYSPWATTVLGMGTRADEVISAPDSGYDIGGGYEYLVLYASETGITLHIGREDEFPGYVLHVLDVCIEPDLLALYRRNHAAGRGELPALRGRQPFGRALGGEIKIAVRDTGSFMDPRSRNDWWQGR